MPRRRILSQQRIADALQVAGECRAGCIRILTDAPINSPASNAARDVMAAIDGLAEVLVGNRTHFHLKPHGGNSPGSHG